MYNVVGIAGCDQNMTPATRREKSQQIKVGVVGIVDNQKPGFVAIAKPVLSSFKGGIFVSNTTKPRVRGLRILLSACINPKDPPITMRACQLPIPVARRNMLGRGKKAGMDVLVSIILRKLEAKL
jgi:hypothetical protein